jgi:small subunit ribosomal protein S16
MSTRIRLQRAGMKKAPFYRVVVADQRAPRDGKFVELLGRYNPRTHPSTVELDVEKTEAWIAKGAQPSEVVLKLLAIAKGEKEAPKDEKIASKKSVAKAEAEKATKAKAAEEAAKAKEAPAEKAPVEEAVSQEAAAEEAPAEEPAAEEAPAEEPAAEEAAAAEEPAAEEAPVEEAAADEAPAEEDAPAEETPAEDAAE